MLAGFRRWPVATVRPCGIRRALGPTPPVQRFLRGTDGHTGEMVPRRADADAGDAAVVVGEAAHHASGYGEIPTFRPSADRSGRAERPERGSADPRRPAGRRRPTGGATPMTCRMVDQPRLNNIVSMTEIESAKAARPHPSPPSGSATTTERAAPMARLVGVDLARALAVFGMFAVHVGPSTHRAAALVHRRSHPVRGDLVPLLPPRPAGTPAQQRDRTGEPRPLNPVRRNALMVRRERSSAISPSVRCCRRGRRPT